VDGSCEHGNEPSGSIKCGENLSSRTIGGVSSISMFNITSPISFGFDLIEVLLNLVPHPFQKEKRNNGIRAFAALD
jgi:predicted metalloenzyme YecM